MRKVLFNFIFALAALSAVGLLALKAQTIIQTQQPVVADVTGTGVTTEPSLLSVLSAVEELRDEIVADNPVRILNEATSTGGWGSHNATGSDGGTPCTNSAQAVKASGGNVGGWIVRNPNTADSWLNVYNIAAASVQVGTSNVYLSIPIPGISSGSVAAHVEAGIGVSLSSAIAISCTSTEGGGAAPSNAVSVNLLFK